MELLNNYFSQLSFCLALAIGLPIYRGSSYVSSKLNLEALDLNGLESLLPILLDY